MSIDLVFPIRYPRLPVFSIAASELTFPPIPNRHGDEILGLLSYHQISYNSQWHSEVTSKVTQSRIEVNSRINLAQVSLPRRPNHNMYSNFKYLIFKIPYVRLVVSLKLKIFYMLNIDLLYIIGKLLRFNQNALKYYVDIANLWKKWK